MSPGHQRHAPSSTHDTRCDPLARGRTDEPCAPPAERTYEHSGLRSKSSGFPRKEVIQPHLPVRLPCYDFTPIIDPTFDGCLPEGLAHRLRVLPTFVV
jgi:hypothetical protein